VPVVLRVERLLEPGFREFDAVRAHQVPRAQLERRVAERDVARQTEREHHRKAERREHGCATLVLRNGLGPALAHCGLDLFFRITCGETTVNLDWAPPICEPAVVVKLMLTCLTSPRTPVEMPPMS